MSNLQYLFLCLKPHLYLCNQRKQRNVDINRFSRWKSPTEHRTINRVLSLNVKLTAALHLNQTKVHLLLYRIYYSIPYSLAQHLSSSSSSLLINLLCFPLIEITSVVSTNSRFQQTTRACFVKSESHSARRIHAAVTLQKQWFYTSKGLSSQLVFHLTQLTVRFYSVRWNFWAALIFFLINFY